MRIHNCRFRNYRAFSEVDIALDGKSTIIFGANGTGKSTLLSAINKVMYIWVKKANGKQAKYSFAATDVRHNTKECQLELDISIDNSVFSLFRKYVLNPIEGRRGNESRNDSVYKSFDDFYIETYVKAEKNIPVFLSYGTNRTAADISIIPNPNVSFDMVASLERAIESKIDFKSFFEWFRMREDYENEMKISNLDLNYTDQMLNCVKKAIQNMLDDVTDLRINRSTLSMVVNKDGQELQVEQLSDGEKCTLALFGDIARRLAIANQNTDDPLTGKGIILIDEIELHMHPSWQRKILAVLHQTFPNIQFIVTTHSPQVLGETNGDYKVIVLKSDHAETTVEEIGRMDAFDSNMILEEYMDTSSKNKEITARISRINYLIGNKQYTEAENAIVEFSEISGMNHPDVVQLTAYLKRMRWLDEKNRKDF